MSYKKLIEISKEELFDYLKCHTNKEAAAYFDRSCKTIQSLRNKYGLSAEKVKYGHYSELTEQQKNFLIASMLGDGTIDKKCQRFKIGQAICRKEYVEWAYDILKPYSLDVKDFHDKYPSTRMRTCAHSVFGDLRKKWYEDKKIIPKDLKLNSEILAHWYLQDGYNNQKKKSVRMSTHAFTTEEVVFLIERLKIDFDIFSTLNYAKNKPTIHIGARSYIDMLNIVRSYITFNCFQYKLDTSKVKKNKVNMIGSKLNMEKAKQIRLLFNHGVQILELASLYQVCEKSIYNILNNKTYWVDNNSAIVSVEYNPVMVSLKI